jgi:hypothetical protein
MFTIPICQNPIFQYSIIPIVSEAIPSFEIRYSLFDILRFAV